MPRSLRSALFAIAALGPALGLSFATPPAQAQQAGRQSIKPGEDAFEYCRRVLTDDDPGPVPASLLPAFERAFSGTPVSPYFRCDRGTVLGCEVGANLNCGKADTSRSSEGGDAWCRSHPNDRIVPMAATGHDTIYEWHCSGTRAMPAGTVSKVDDRGFEATNWRVLN